MVLCKHGQSKKFGGNHCRIPHGEYAATYDRNDPVNRRIPDNVSLSSIPWTLFQILPSNSIGGRNSDNLRGPTKPKETYRYENGAANRRR